MSEKYQKPHLGQTFFRHPNQDKLQRDFSMCVGLTENGEVRGELQWSAILQDGRGGTEQITHRSVLGSGSWRPLPQEELETQYGPGYRILVERVERFGDAAQGADEALASAVDALVKQVEGLETALGEKATLLVDAVTLLDALSAKHAETVQRLQERIAALEKGPAPTPPAPAPPAVEPVGARPPVRKVVGTPATQ